MSFRTEDDAKLLTAFESWRRAQPNPDALTPGEVVEGFMVEREQRQSPYPQ